MATLYIRNIDAIVVAKLDELAKKKKTSRNKIVASILTASVGIDFQKEIQDQYSRLLETTVDSLNLNTAAIQELQKQIAELGEAQDE